MIYEFELWKREELLNNNFLTNGNNKEEFLYRDTRFYLYSYRSWEFYFFRLDLFWVVHETTKPELYFSADAKT